MGTLRLSAEFQVNLEPEESEELVIRTNRALAKMLAGLLKDVDHEFLNLSVGVGP